MASIKNILLCPKSHLRQFTLWLNLTVQRPSQSCEVAHAFEISSYRMECCTPDRRNLFPYFFPPITDKNSCTSPVPPSYRSANMQEFRSCSTLCFNCFLHFRSKSFFAKNEFLHLSLDWRDVRSGFLKDHHFESLFIFLQFLDLVTQGNKATFQLMSPLVFQDVVSNLALLTAG